MIEVTIDFSYLSLSEEKDILKYLSKDDRKKFVSDDGSLNQKLMKIIDFASLHSDVYHELVGKAYDELSFDQKARFIADRLEDAHDADIEDYYNDNIRLDDDDDDDDYEENSFDPDTAGDPARIRMVAHTLRAYNRSRLRPTLKEAMETVKQMYDYMGWK